MTAVVTWRLVCHSQFAVSQTVVSAVVSEGCELCVTVHH